MTGLSGDQPPTQEPTISYLTRTKDAPTTQEITTVLGALCQDPG